MTITKNIILLGPPRRQGHTSIEARLGPRHGPALDG